MLTLYPCQCVSLTFLFFFRKGTGQSHTRFPLLLVSCAQGFFGPLQSKAINHALVSKRHTHEQDSEL